MTALADYLGTLPSGKIVAMVPNAMGQFIKINYVTNSKQRERVKIAEERLDLYRDECQKMIKEALERLFKNSQVLDWRMDLVEFSLFQNLTRRIVNDTANVYAEPATRSVTNGLETYRELVRICQTDARMEQANRYLQLLNDVLIYFDIRSNLQPVIRIATPDKFWAVAHPNDPTWLVAVVISTVPQTAVVQPNDPHYLVMSEDETFSLDKNCNVVPGSHKPHSIGRIPAIHAQREPRDDQLLNPTLGHDLTSGHKAIALLNVLMLKNQKSGTKVPYATGDTSGMAREQPMDEDHVLEVPEGVQLGALDMGADPRTFIDSARAVIKQIAANHGISETMFDLSYQATSGFEIKLKRIGLHEIRIRQIKTFRAIERELAELQSLVLASHSHKLRFNTAGWAIDFGAVDEPGTSAELTSWWDWLEAKGLYNRTEMYMTLNPEATEVEAQEIIADNLASKTPSQEMTVFDASLGTAQPPPGDGEDDAS